MPWTRQFGATESKLRYHVRMCIEGVPVHGAQVETISQLLPEGTFVENIDTKMHTEAEKACLCVWIWAVDPDAIAVEGVLKLEEPIEFTGEFHNDFFTRLGNMEPSDLRNDAAKMLDYQVILHVDRAIDYTAPASSPS